MIHRTPPISGTLRRSLDELDEAHAKLAHEVQRPAVWRGRLRREALVNSIVASTSIEGFHVTPAQARSIVDGTSPTASDGEDHWAVACYARAIEHVQVMSDDPLFDWNHRVVLDLHFDTCQFQRGRTPGRYRTGPVHVTAPDGTIAYTAPEAESAVGLMGEMLSWLNGADDLHPIVRAAMAHLHFVSIHPFRDGNGRVGRILQSLALGRASILAPEFASIEPYLAANTQDYYGALQVAHGPTYDPSRSVVEWLEFCVGAHLSLARDFESRAHALARFWNDIERLVEQRGWPDRLAVAINLAVNEVLTRAAYIAETGATVTTATSDIRRLGDAGFLTQRGAGPSTSYVASDELRDAIERAD